jgi:hypothetical protein
VKLSLYRPLVPVHSYDRLPSYVLGACGGGGGGGGGVGLFSGRF